MKKMIKLSASDMGKFKDCPVSWRNACLWGIRPIEVPGALFDGTNWHEGLEIMAYKEGSLCFKCAERQSAGPHEVGHVGFEDCPICLGTGFMVGEPIEAVGRCFERAYSTLNCQSLEEAVKKETTRTKLLYSLAAYRWLWEDDDDIEVIGTEIKFELPLKDPRTGRSIPNVRVCGTIDKLVWWGSQVFVMEHKSTSDDLGGESDYWDRLRFDMQTTIYPMAATMLQQQGDLKDYGVMPDDDPVNGVLYDVYRKPLKKIKEITQADTRKLFTEGTYCDQEFSRHMDFSDVLHMINEGQAVEPTVNEALVEVTPGAVGKNGKVTAFSIRETQEMYGARIMQDIVANPGKTFVRREITRDESDYDRCRKEMVALYRSMRHMQHSDQWYSCDKQCKNYGKCDYVPVCYGNIEIGPDRIPDGFHEVEDRY